MKLTFIIISFFIFYICYAAKPDSLLNITKPKMMDDYNLLMQIINDVFPRTTPFSLINSYTVNDNLNMLKKEIINCNDYFSFVQLINYALSLTHDGHSSIENAEDLRYFIKYLPENERKGLLCNIDTNYINWQDTIRKVIKYRNNINAVIKYINGSYYNIRTFTFNKKIYKKSLVLLKCNDIPINKFISDNLQCFKLLQWDSKNKIFYINNVLQSLFLQNTSLLKLTFKNELDGSIIEDVFDLNKKVEIESKFKIYINCGVESVKYFKQIHILYIRVPKMDYSFLTFFQKQIKKYKYKKIEKIFIDIRGNRGGDDRLWMGILKQIIKTPITSELKLCAANSEKVINYINKPDLKIEKINFLNNQEFLIIDNETEILEPEINGLNFGGKIFLLQDDNIFSSAISLSTIAKNSEQIISVGSNAGFIGGRGITPFVFMLPNSKIMFSIDPCLDISYCKNLNDLFNRVEIEVPVDADYLNKRYTMNYTNKKFLLNHDPIFKKALELK